MVCLFGMTIIAGVSGKSLVKGIIAACLGLLISCVGADPMTSYDRFTFGIPRLYLGLDLAVTLIGLFALVEIIGKAELKRNELNLHAGKIGNDDGKITKDEYKRMFRPVLMGSIIGSCVGIVPGTGASEARGSPTILRRTCPSIPRNSATVLWRALRLLSLPTMPSVARP